MMVFKKNINYLFLFFILTGPVVVFYSCNSATKLISRTKDLYTAGQYDEAIIAGKRATAANADNPDGWYWLAMSLFEKNQMTEAYNAFYYVTTLDTGMHALEAYRNMCLIDYEKGDYTSYSTNHDNAHKFHEAHYFSAGLEKPAEFMTTIDYYMGLIYSGEAEYHKAIVEFSGFGAFQPGQYTTYPYWTIHSCYVNRGWCYIKEGKDTAAFDDFTSAVKIDGDDNNKLKTDYNGMAWASYYLGKYKDALNAFNKAYSLAIPADTTLVTSIYRGEAYTYLALKDKLTALAQIEKIKTMDPDYDVNYDYAKIYFASGDKENAWKYLGGNGFIGVEAEFLSNEKVSGAKIIKLENNGPAMNAGLQKGDIITIIDSKKIESTISYRMIMHALVPGNIATIIIVRDGSQKSYSLKAESAEKEMAGDPVISKILK